MILLLDRGGRERGFDVHTVVVGSRSAPISVTSGQLLVATPPLEDPNFDRTVVYVIDHGDDGTVGVVVNRPTDDSLDDPIDRWTEFMAEPAVLFEGGPVERNALIGLGHVRAHDTADPDGTEIGWTSVTRDLASIDLSLDPALFAGAVHRLRVFRGYSGWSPGQLEMEIEEGAWIVVDATLDDVFTSEPTELWRSVLRRQGGTLAWIANAPDDLSAN